MHHFSIIRLLNLIAAGLVVLVAGCTADPTSGTATVDQVSEVTAELLGVERRQVTADTNLEDLGADELDYVELVMELEEKFQVEFTDEGLQEMMGTTDWKEGMKKVTMAQLAEAVDQLQQQ